MLASSVMAPDTILGVGRHHGMSSLNIEIFVFEVDSVCCGRYLAREMGQRDGPIILVYIVSRLMGSPLKYHYGSFFTFLFLIFCGIILFAFAYYHRIRKLLLCL